MAGLAAISLIYVGSWAGASVVFVLVAFVTFARRDIRACRVAQGHLVHAGPVRRASGNRKHQDGMAMPWVLRPESIVVGASGFLASSAAVPENSEAYVHAGFTVFGAELRRLRVEAGHSLTRMAGLVHYSKAQLSKIETGRKSPTPDLARRCDAILDTGGKLASLVSTRPSEALPSEEGGNGEVWMMHLGSDGGSWFQPVARRRILAGGVASVLAFGLGGNAPLTGTGSPLESFRAMFDQFRQLGQTGSASVVLPALIAQTHTMRVLAEQAKPADRREILKLGARYAEYAGWMFQEAGDDPAALWWTDRAVEMAAAGEDHDLATYSLVRRALVALYRQDIRQTIEPADEARRAKVPARIRGLAAQRVAQGHALAGDYDACMRNLDQARELLSAREPESAPTLGPTNPDDPSAMVAGWCLYDLGRYEQSAAILDRELPRVRATALRSRARFGMRRALAHAAAGNTDYACSLVPELLDMSDTVGSATVATDIRSLDRTLARFSARSSVRELQPRLTLSLHQYVS